MTSTALFIRHKARPGKRDDVRRVWEKHARDYLSGSNGLLTYAYCYDDNDPDVILVFQLAADQASGQDFLKQPWFAEYERETSALLKGPSEFHAATPRWAKAQS